MYLFQKLFINLIRRFENIWKHLLKFFLEFHNGVPQVFLFLIQSSNILRKSLFNYFTISYCILLDIPEGNLVRVCPWDVTLTFFQKFLKKSLKKFLQGCLFYFRALKICSGVSLLKFLNKSSSENSFKNYIVDAFKKK